MPVYILDDVNSGEWAMGGASRWWLYHSLRALNTALQGRLLVLRGDASQLLPALVSASGAASVVWNRCYEPWRIQRDAKLKEALRARGCQVESFNASLLWEPWQVLKEDKTPYKVFTPFFRRGCLLNAPSPARPLPAPAHIHSVALDDYQQNTGERGIDQLELLPRINWYSSMTQRWTIGEDAAWRRLQDFLNNGLQGYREGRNYPAQQQVSALSPHLHFGEISPRQVWHEALSAGVSSAAESDLDCFQSELAWREFSHSLLYHQPDLPRLPIQPRFAHFPWQQNPDWLQRWQRGETGIPLVDAGMRELWQTGYMHNRVRMVTGSFLVKNLLTHWHQGQRWFWDCLVDADLANNAASWQWIAGCGADAAPYFRVFNPVTQSEKFDANGEYLRRYLPELASLPAKYIHAPFTAPDSVLRAAGVKLGENYPLPVADLKSSREMALAAFQHTKDQT